MQQPADVSRQLLCLGAGQQHAVVECVQETFFGDPAPTFDQLLMHDRDLPGRPAETDAAKFQPEAPGLAQGDGIGAGQVVRRCAQALLRC